MTAHRPYHLTRNFALGSAAILVLCALALGQFNRLLALDHLEAMVERNNVALTRTLANDLWPEFRGYIGAAAALPAEALAEHLEVARLGDAVRRLMAGTGVVKVKLYDAAGLTVFSSAAAQIGQSYAENPRFRAAVAGATVSMLEHREGFAAMDGTVEDRWILSSYIPVSPVSARAPEGVAEIYSDVTALYAETQMRGVHHVAAVLAGFLLLFLLLVALVRRADLLIQRNHAQMLQLSASKAKAEAADKAKSEFLAHMSHELRTPLNAIIGFSELIKDEIFGPIGDARYREYAENVRGSAHHLLAIISRVLELVQLEKGSARIALDAVDVAACVRDTLHALRGEAERRGVALGFEDDGSAGTIESDAGKIRTILANLVANAVKFSPRGTAVEVCAERFAAGGWIRLAVKDAGRGMSAEAIPQALSPFSNPNARIAHSNEGAGLGLALSSRLAELLGGRLEIESKPGRGTTVTVTLPTRLSGVIGERLAAA